MARVIGNAPASAPQPQRQNQQPVQGAAPQGQQQPATASVDPISKLIGWFKNNKWIALVIGLVFFYFFLLDIVSLREGLGVKNMSLLFWGSLFIGAYRGGDPKQVVNIMLTILIIGTVFSLVGITPRQIAEKTVGGVSLVADGMNDVTKAARATVVGKEKDKGIRVELKPGRCPTGLHVDKGQSIVYSSWTAEFLATETGPVVDGSHSVHHATNDGQLVLWGKGNGEVYVKLP